MSLLAELGYSNTLGVIIRCSTQSGYSSDKKFGSLNSGKRPIAEIAVTKKAQVLSSARFN
jgi:hypothetical protein